ncbi:MAG: hypothetical protein WCO68_03495, partial [Verrucomicrobiota bacterium]
MKITNIVRVVLVLFAFAAVSGGMPFAAAKPEDEAQKSAEQWLALEHFTKKCGQWLGSAEG